MAARSGMVGCRIVCVRGTRRRHGARSPRSSEDRRLRVGAPDVLEGFDDLALAGMGAGGVEQCGHQVLAGCRGLTNAMELPLDGGGVAAGADGLDAVDLLAFQGGVYAEDLD